MATVKSLKVLDLSHNNLSFSYFALSSVIAANRYLKHLNISYCDLRESTMISLFKMDVKIVNISGNIISNLVAILVKTSIGSTSSLSLSKCSLQEKGLTKLMRNVKHHLEYLDISYNIVTDKAARDVADLIFRNAKLKHLDLSNCEMQRKGLAIILNAIKDCTVLKYVDLKSNCTMVDDALASDVVAFIITHFHLQNWIHQLIVKESRQQMVSHAHWCCTVRLYCSFVVPCGLFCGLWLTSNGFWSHCWQLVQVISAPLLRYHRRAAPMSPMLISLCL